MGKIQVTDNVTTAWVDLVQEAEKRYDLMLTEEVENYLVFVLQRYMCQPDVVTSMVGAEFLVSETSKGYLAQQQLRDVGDKCLLFSGLYPELALRRRVPVRYFVEIGQTAYNNASQCVKRQALLSALFYTLSTKFVRMMDVLHSMRELGGCTQQLSLAQAEAFLQEVGSLHAEKFILRQSESVPDFKHFRKFH